MSDLFHEDVPDNFVSRVWSVMAQTPRHTYQILTKRPDRMKAVVARRALPALPNVWLGPSVEDGRVLYRLDELRETPAVVRFVSFEPLIGSVVEAKIEGIHWLSWGESGPRARPMKKSGLKKFSHSAPGSRNGVFLSNGVGANKESRRPPLSRSNLMLFPDLRI